MIKNVEEASPKELIKEWCIQHPLRAIEILTSTVSFLVLDYKDQVLDEGDSYPSGADFIANFDEDLELSGLALMIRAIRVRDYGVVNLQRFDEMLERMRDLKPREWKKAANLYLEELMLFVFNRFVKVKDQALRDPTAPSRNLVVLRRLPNGACAASFASMEPLVGGTWITENLLERLSIELILSSLEPVSLRS